MAGLRPDLLGSPLYVLVEFEEREGCDADSGGDGVVPGHPLIAWFGA
jgi:hypothetical protein